RHAHSVPTRRSSDLSEAPGKRQGLVFPHPTTGGLTAAGPAYYEALEITPFGNELLFDLAKTAITSEKLGANGTTDLLCVSFSSRSEEHTSELQSHLN